MLLAQQVAGGAQDVAQDPGNTRDVAQDAGGVLAHRFISICKYTEIHWGKIERMAYCLVFHPAQGGSHLQKEPISSQLD
jgi:hypothetical protein